MVYQPFPGIPDVHPHFFCEFSLTDITTLKGLNCSSLLLTQISYVNLIAGNNSLPDKFSHRGFPFFGQRFQSFGQFWFYFYM